MAYTEKPLTEFLKYFMGPTDEPIIALISDNILGCHYAQFIQIMNGIIYLIQKKVQELEDLQIGKKIWTEFTDKDTTDEMEMKKTLQPQFFTFPKLSGQIVFLFVEILKPNSIDVKTLSQNWKLIVSRQNKKDMIKRYNLPFLNKEKMQQKQQTSQYIIQLSNPIELTLFDDIQLFIPSINNLFTHSKNNDDDEEEQIEFQSRAISTNLDALGICDINDEILCSITKAFELRCENFFTVRLLLRSKFNQSAHTEQGIFI